MATVKCKDCGTEVSKRAKTCPKCGAPMNRNGCVPWILGGGVVLIIIAINGANDRRERFDIEITPKKAEELRYALTTAGKSCANVTAARYDEYTYDGLPVIHITCDGVTYKYRSSDGSAAAE